MQHEPLSRSGSYDLSQLLAQKIMKGIHSCKPASLNCPLGVRGLATAVKHLENEATVSFSGEILCVRFTYSVCFFM